MNPKKPKINLDFPNASQDLYEAQQLKKFRINNPHTHSPEAQRWATFCIIGTFIGMLIFGTAGAILLVVLDLPAWVNTCIILFILCVISVAFAIVNDAKKRV